MQAGCVLGSIFAGLAADTIGRRPSLLLANLLVATSSALLLLPLAVASSDSLTPLYIGRGLLGLGGGLACTALPLHVSETAPTAYRGALEASFQLGICIGVLAAYSINLAVHGAATGWVFSLAAPLVPSAVYLCWATAHLIESPRFLVLRGCGARTPPAVSTSLSSPCAHL